LFSTKHKQPAPENGKDPLHVLIQTPILPSRGETIQRTIQAARSARMIEQETYAASDLGQMTDSIFHPSRDMALSRLAQFVPSAGRHYEAGRNTDAGPDQPGAVSRLSPYLRYRLIEESEVVSQVLARHPFDTAEKFVQEVLWRTYWKGWLEMRPSVWSRFLDERDRQLDAFPDRRALLAAENGQTGIEGFDDWARELVETGYLHNHARMWFASIWIFTLRLPWSLGADFFLRNLLDADAASNTLSWRWVAGLQTAGKTYLATAENIARFTNGRFAPKGLAREAFTLTEPPIEAACDLRELAPYDSKQPSLLLLTHEDLHPESVFESKADIRSIMLVADAHLLWGENARRFVSAAATDTAARAAAHFGCGSHLHERLDLQSLIAATHAAQVNQIVTPYAPTGPVADALAQLAPGLARANVRLAQIRRKWDSAFWPHAKKGFFPFKAKIPAVLHDSGLI